MISSNEKVYKLRTENKPKPGPEKGKFSFLYCVLHWGGRILLGVVVVVLDPLLLIIQITRLILKCFIEALIILKILYGGNLDFIGSKMLF